MGLTSSDATSCLACGLMTSLLEQFASTVERHPDRVAIVDGQGRETTFLELQTRSRALAALWHGKGIGQGDRVLLAMPVNADLYAGLAALWSLGATVVLPEPAMGLGGLRHAARVTAPKAFCASGPYIFLKYLVPELFGVALLRPQSGQGVPPPVTVSGSDIALISFTSGTTGKPKAIPRSHAFLLAQNEAVLPLLQSERQERDLVAFPVFTLVNLVAGQTSVLPNWKMSKMARLTTGALMAWVASQGVTRLLVPPSICEKLDPTALPEGLYTVFTGGGPVFPDLVSDLQERSDVRVVCIYGSTEAEPIAHLEAQDITAADIRDMAEGRGLLVGRPVSRVEVRIDNGEILVAGGHVNSGYLDPAQNAGNKVIDGDTTWHRTGDAGVFDDAGRLWLLGRCGSEITMPDGPLYPFSVEVAARYWPGAERSALVGAEGRPILVVQGDRKNLSEWRDLAGDFGISEVRCVDQIPMDKRHNSKVDRVALSKQIANCASFRTRMFSAEALDGGQS